MPMRSATGEACLAPTRHYSRPYGTVHAGDARPYKPGHARPNTTGDAGPQTGDARRAKRARTARTKDGVVGAGHARPAAPRDFYPAGAGRGGRAAALCYYSISKLE